MSTLAEDIDRLGVTTLRIKRERDQALNLLEQVQDGFVLDPGHSDLDDEQPISVSMTLGVYRAICRTVREGK